MNGTSHSAGCLCWQPADLSEAAQWRSFVYMKSSRPYRSFAARIRILAVFMWILSGILALILAACIVIYRNPWTVHHIDAAASSVEELEAISKGHSPYVEISGIDLIFTGYYETTDDEKICSYCYMGTVGDRHILVDMPVEDGGALAENSDGDGSTISGAKIRGRANMSGEMVEWLAQDEGISREAYSSKYQLSFMEIHVYHNDQEKIRIYQLMILVLAAGCLATGAILWGEMRSAGGEDPSE